MRFNIPNTWNIWDRHNLKSDSSIGFYEHIGFRAGTCYEYPVYDVVNRKMLRLTERPLIVMDTALKRIADNGKEAIDALSKRDYDLVLMDCQMPEMDGYEATRVIRDPNSPVRNHDITIIAMTANAMTGDRKKCLDAGMNDYVTKPIRAEVLGEAIERYFPGRNDKIQPASSAKVDSAELSKSDDRSGSPQAIQSEFADDPDMVKIIDNFVEGLPATISSMRDAANHNHHEELQRLAHQLKGAGGGYGYPLLTQTAKTLEDAAKAHDIEKAMLVLSSLNQLCNAVVTGHEMKAIEKGVKS